MACFKGQRSLLPPSLVLVIRRSRKNVSHPLVQLFSSIKYYCMALWVNVFIVNHLRWYLVTHQSRHKAKWYQQTWLPNDSYFIEHTSTDTNKDTKCFIWSGSCVNYYSVNKCTHSHMQYLSTHTDKRKLLRLLSLLSSSHHCNKLHVGLFFTPYCLLLLLCDLLSLAPSISFFPCY